MNIVFHIGYHKTGTTWLQKKIFLSGFNSIVDSSKPWTSEIMRYLVLSSDVDFNKDFFISLVNEKAVDNKVNLISSERLTGHPFSGKYDRYRIANRIHEAFPNAKILCGVREPCSLLESTYKQMIKEGYTGKMNNFLFDEYWKNIGNSLDGYNFFKLYQHYVNLFGLSNVFFYSFSDLKSNQEKLLKSIMKHCGVDDKKNIIIDNEPVNVAYSNSYYRALRLMNYFKTTEYNPLPLVKGMDLAIFFLQKFLSKILSNKPFLLEEHIQAINQSLDTDYNKMIDQIENNV